MRRFNPKKELYKIQHGNRNKIILFVILLLLVVGVIGYSFALYQVRYSKRIIYTKVAPFSNKDIQLAVYLDGKPLTSVPEKGTAYYDSIVCDNDPNVSARWDYDKWKLKEFEVSVPNKCDINFTKNYRDQSGANAPELYQGLIPVYYGDNGEVYISNLEEKWYDYDDKRWANAVLVDNSKEEIKTKYFKEDGNLKENIENIEIPMEEILQMYVWIPRYKYQLFNVGNGSINPQEIQIQFEFGALSSGDVTCTISDKGVESCIGAEKNKWYTHPAFTFGNTELPGIWIGKFEPSGNVNTLTIKPNISSLMNINIKTMFDASRNIEEQYASDFNLNKEEIDTHMMKSMEWGAMAYLTQSKYGRCTNGSCVEVNINSNSSCLTGYASQVWQTTNGQLASTTGNLYGIYDTNGGAWEYNMGNMVNANGAFYSSEAGFSVAPDSRYYDVYEYGTSEKDHQRGHLGDATRETLTAFGNNYGGAWYGGFASFPHQKYSWLTRGGNYSNGNLAGTFSYGRHTGEAAYSFRVVLTQQDGNE